MYITVYRDAFAVKKNFPENMLEVKYVAIYDELLDHVMWRPRAKQHNGQLGTRVILNIWIGFSEHGIPKENVT